MPTTSACGSSAQTSRVLTRRPAVAVSDIHRVAGGLAVRLWIALVALALVAGLASPGVATGTSVGVTAANGYRYDLPSAATNTPTNMRTDADAHAMRPSPRTGLRSSTSRNPRRLGAAKAADDIPQFRVRNAGPNRPGTRVPESFDLDVAGSSYRVHPNATKHLAEYARKHSSSGEFPTSPIAGAVEQAQRQGLRPGRNFGRYGDFELGIDAKDNVIYHLVYRPGR